MVIVTYCYLYLLAEDKGYWWTLVGHRFQFEYQSRVKNCIVIIDSRYIHMIVALNALSY